MARLIIFVMLVAVSGCDGTLPEAQHSFVPTTWQSDVDARAAMVADLQAIHLKNGMSPSEVEQLLGTPGEAIPTKDVFKPDPRDKELWYYELSIGPCFDVRQFVVHFDHSDKVRESTLFCN